MNVIEYLYDCIGASQKFQGPEHGPGPHPFHSPVLYPRSIPPFHTCLKDPFHTSVPYLCSIPLFYICTYIYIYLSLSLSLYGCMAVLEWAGSRPRPAMYHPWPTPRVNILPCVAMFSHRLLLSYPLRMGYGSPRVLRGGDAIHPFGDLWVLRSRQWDLRDRSEAERAALHGSSQWMTLATGCVLASAQALAIQDKPALNRCTRILRRWEVKRSCS